MILDFRNSRKNFLKGRKIFLSRDRVFDGKHKKKFQSSIRCPKSKEKSY